MITFNKIREDVDIDCIKEFNPKENTEDIFIRALKLNEINERSLKSHWENGVRNANTSKEICGLKGLSFNILMDGNIRSILKKYRAINEYKPYKKFIYYCKIKFRKNAGKVWDDKSIDNSHRIFFKCDTFTANDIEVLEILQLNNSV